MQLKQIFSTGLSIITLLSLSLLIGIPDAMARRNGIISYTVVSNTPKELILDVQYYYNGSHGDEAYMGSAMADNNQVSPYYGHNPGRLKLGQGTTRLRLSTNERTAPPEFTTNQIYLHMYDGITGNFYDEFFPFVKTWGTGHSVERRAPEYPTRSNSRSSHEANITNYWVIKDEPDQLVLGIEYYYKRGYDNRGQVIQVILGLEPTGPDTLGSGIGFTPVALRPGRNTATIDMTKLTSGNVSSDGFRLHMYTCESDRSCRNSKTIFSRNYSYRKEWYKR